VIIPVSPVMDPAMDMSIAMSQGIHMCHGCDCITTGNKYCSRCTEERQQIENQVQSMVGRHKRILVGIDEDYEKVRRRANILADSALVICGIGFLVIIGFWCGLLG
jgi:hypothetical protein